MSLQSRNRQRGKAAESAVADYLGWLRYGIFAGEDLIDPSGDWSGEVKSRQSCVISPWYKQAEKNAKRSKRKGWKRPVVFIHLKGTKHEASDLAVIHIQDFKRLITCWNNNNTPWKKDEVDK